MRRNIFFINTYLDKAREVMRRLAFTPNVGVGHLIVHKRLGYTIIQNKKATMDKGKIIMGSASTILEVRPGEPSPKRERIIKEQDPHIEEYSSTQSPLWIRGSNLLERRLNKRGHKEEYLLFK